MSATDRRGCNGVRVSLPRRKRTGGHPAPSAREALERRWLAWLLLRQAGLTYREIAECTGFSVGAIFHGVGEARKIAGRGPAGSRDDGR